MEALALKLIFKEGFSHLREREIESILSFSNGYLGTRNSLEESYHGCDPATFIADMYVQGPDDEFNFLVKIPDWTRIKIYLDGEQLNMLEHKALHHIRYIDFESGLIVREWQNLDANGKVTNVKISKFISLAKKNYMGKLLEIEPENYTGFMKVETGIDCNAGDFEHLLNMNSESSHFALVHMKTKYMDKELKILQKSTIDDHSIHKHFIENSYDGSFEIFEWKAEMARKYTIKSLCSLNCHPVSLFDKELNEHKEKWRKRWDNSKITIKGNVNDQKLVNFAVYHLINSGEFSGNNCSIPARNLSGEAYKGHIFWDTEMYLLPFYTLTNPEVAKALLMYRYNTLDGARQNAIREGRKGASFAWESTDNGLETAPHIAILPSGEVIHILSGKYENHISPDIAYTVWKYWEATGDNDFIKNYGAEILFETARYCESLLQKGDDGLYHINKVIGPDEYHELVDDNAYTNYLVRNNFDVAIKAKKMMNIQDDEAEKWKEYRDNIYSGLSGKTGLFEQFKGYYNLEYVDLSEFEPRTVPMDIILGKDSTQLTQIIKQPDVLMFMFLFGERFSKEDIAVNYDFYEKRCSHGSSLSPGIHSLMSARLGRTKEAYSYFHKNAKIDLGDEFGNAAGGIHIASIGAVWMSVVFGFAGLYYTEDGYYFDPHLPDEWESLEFSIIWRGQKKNIYIDREVVLIKDNEDDSR